MKAWKEDGSRDQYKKLLDIYKAEKLAFDKKYPHENEGPFVVRSFSEILEMPTEPSKVSYDKIGISLHVYGIYNTLDIEWDRIKNTKESIIGWIIYLTHKRWCSPKLIYDFIECVCEHFKIKNYKIW